MIGLIFGETNLPHEILKNIKRKKLKYLIIDLTIKRLFKKDKHSYSVFIGQFGKILDILKTNKCKKVIFAGKVRKPNFSKLRIDLKGMYYLPKIIKSSKLGDAAILKEIIKILKSHKIKTIDSLTFNPELTLKKGCYSKRRPNQSEEQDITKARQVLNSLGDYNFSQGVVVENKKLIAVENKTGTQGMLKRCKSKKIKNGILVKFPKRKQDLRVDLPTIGINTLIHAFKVGIKGIVLMSNKHIILDKKRCIDFANKKKMFIYIK